MSLAGKYMDLFSGMVFIPGLWGVKGADSLPAVPLEGEDVGRNFSSGQLMTCTWAVEPASYYS